MKRASGILLPVFSLPSKYGIGCFSKEAYRFNRPAEKKRDRATGRFCLLGRLVMGTPHTSLSPHMPAILITLT